MFFFYFVPKGISLPILIPFGLLKSEWDFNFLKNLTF